MGARPRNNLVRWVARTGVLLALTLAFQGLRLGQAFTGPLVNAALFASAVVVGIGGGVFIGAVTPWVALAVGILKPPLAPAVPFIMLGNAALVTVAARSGGAPASGPSWWHRWSSLASWAAR